MTHINNPYFCRVGRVESFQEAGKDTKLSPVSCTVYEVEDSMDSIAESWKFLAMAVKGGAGVAIDLSNLRAKGVVGRGGLVSLGVCNFLPVYSSIVAAVRQGKAGVKKGAGLVYISANSPDLEEFVNLPTSLIPSIKRAVYVRDEDLLNPKIVSVLLNAMAKGDIFLSKIVYNKKGQRLFTNLCTEVFIKSQGTCILGQINLGLVKDPADIPKIFIDSFYDLDNVWKLSFESTLDSLHFLHPLADKQIGLGVIGLANMLSRFKVKYVDFVQALKKTRQDYYNITRNVEKLSTAELLAFNLYQGYRLASDRAKAESYERAFAIAPTASVSYRNLDADGYTCTPEISPPVCNPTTKIVRRLSSEGTDTKQYPYDVEVANVDVSWEIYDELVSEWQMMQDVQGLAHSISSNWWTTKPFTEENLKAFMASPRLTSYYTYPVEIDAADKTDINMQELQSEDVDNYWGSIEEDPNYCEACAG